MLRPLIAQIVTQAEAEASTECVSYLFTINPSSPQ